MYYWDKPMGRSGYPLPQRYLLFVELALKDTGRMQEFMIKELRQPL